MYATICIISSFLITVFFFFFSSRRRHTRFDCDWSSDVCSSDLLFVNGAVGDVSPRRHGPTALVADARTLATAVEEAWARAAPELVSTLTTRTARVRLPAPTLSLRNCTRPWMPRALTLPLGRTLPRETELTAGALGGTAWVTIPG